MAMTTENPRTSIRPISRRSGVPKPTVRSIVRRNLLYPYHVQRVQALLPTDYNKRIQFCRKMLHRNSQDPHFFYTTFMEYQKQFLEK